MTYVIVLIVIVIFAAGLSLVLRGRNSSDGVDSFRRQIDALSPEARKPTIDQVKSVERDTGDDRPEPRDGSGEGDPASNGDDS